VIPELAHFELSPTFGTGIYRRRLRFVDKPGAVVALADDTHHSYWLTLDHRLGRVTAIDAGFNRAPTDMCPGAVAGLKAVVGASLEEPIAEIMARLPRWSNCTHLVDLALWGIAQVGRSAVWDIEVPDQRDQPVWVTITRDGELIHRWRIADYRMVAPEPFAGQPLLSGFMKWATAAFSGEEMMAATMLQRGLFVARGRRFVVDEGEPLPVASAVGMAGMCWSYSGDRLLHGKGVLGYVRDFTEALHPEAPPRHLNQRDEEDR
jgi:hypothetical protein